MLLSEEKQYREELRELVPAGREGDWRVNNVDGGDFSLEQVSCHRIWMSYEHTELGAHCKLFNVLQPRQRVLIFGLGLGLDTYVASQVCEGGTIATVECEQAVANLVYPHIKDNTKALDCNLHVMRAKEFITSPSMLALYSTSFDIVWFDIFPGEASQFGNAAGWILKNITPFVHHGSHILFWSQYDWWSL